MKKHQRDVALSKRENLGENYTRLSFDFPEIAQSARPGQFLTISKNQPGFPLLRRPFSIHRLNPPNQVQVLIKTVGPGTRQLVVLDEGDTINVLGPLGEGHFSIDEDRPNLLMVAGGIGIAPLLFLADEATKNENVRPVLFFGGCSGGDLGTIDDFEQLKIETNITTEDGSRGAKGLITDVLTDFFSDLEPQKTQVKACGPLPMLKAVAKLCYDREVDCQVSLETVMACGVGSCLGCVTEATADASADGLPYFRVCHEGPVFNINQLPWKKEHERS